MIVKKIVCIIIIFTFFSGLFAKQGDEVVYIEPYSENKIPSWVHDTRRFSIISLGSIPFTMLSTTLGYSVYRYCANGFDSDYIPNPFPTSSEASKLNSDEQIGLLITAASLGIAIGITDLVVNKITESKETKQKQKEIDETIKITPSSNEGIEE